MRSPLKKYSSGFFQTLPLTDRPIGAIIAVFHLRDVVSGRFVVRRNASPHARSVFVTIADRPRISPTDSL